MAFLFTDGSRGGVPIAYNFVYGGTAVPWGTTSLMGMGDVSCRAEPFDGKFSVSELRTTFSDTNGSIWGSLGHGTTGLGSSFAATVYIGGTMGEQGYGANGTRLARLNTGNSGTYVLHTGRITEISRRNRQVEIVSQSAMAQIEDLEWRFPVNNSQTNLDAVYGSMLFQAGYVATRTSQYRPAFFNINDEDNAFEGYAYIGSTCTPSLDYPTPTGRGTMGVLTGSQFLYPGTQFYFDYQRIHLKGTYFATLTNAITTDEEAQRYGYANLAAASAALVSGTYYPNITRLTLDGGGTTGQNGSSIFWQQVLTLGSSPANLWKEMINGCCVTPLFGSSTIDGNTFATALVNTAFQFHQQTIDPKGGKVLPYLKNLLEPLRALWSVSSSNTFRLYTYGPKTYADVLGTIGMSEIVDSAVTSSIDDKLTRVSIDYGYVFETGSYSKTLEIKGAGWGSNTDFPLKLTSAWLDNDNDARLIVQRMLSRFSKGQPKLKLTIPLNRLTTDVGTMLAVMDSDQYGSAKVFEVVGWRKDFSSSREMVLDMWDGEALYSQRGYARWEGDASLTNAVSGTSTSGWGTNGTVHNINTAFYGTQFVWF